MRVEIKTRLMIIYMFKQPWVGESYADCGLMINIVLHQFFISNDDVF